MSSFTSSPRSSGSSFTAPAGADAVFEDINQTIQAVADAFAEPVDTPLQDVRRLVEDAAGNRVEWTWRASTNTWKGVELIA